MQDHELLAANGAQTVAGVVSLKGLELGRWSKGRLVLSPVGEARAKVYRAAAKPVPPKPAAKPAEDKPS